MAINRHCCPRLRKREGIIDDLLRYELDTRALPDQELAELIAEHLIARSLLWRKTMHFTILHDVRLRRRAFDGERPSPCPMQYHWRYKNLVGVTFDREDEARQWIIDALLLGYHVGDCLGSRSRLGGSWGFESWREHSGQRIASNLACELAQQENRSAK